MLQATFYLIILRDDSRIYKAGSEMRQIQLEKIFPVQTVLNLFRNRRRFILACG
jgi:hypothetical protein